MIKVALLDDYQDAARSHADWSQVEQSCEVEVFRRNLSLEEAAEVLQPFAIVCHLRERMAFPRTLIERLPNLRMVAITGSTHRTLDLAACTERGILVCSTQGRAGIQMATPELAWGLILAVARNIPAEAAHMPSGGWQTTVGMLLHGKTLGLLGLGKIGRQVAAYGKAFGMRVVAWSSNLTPEMAQEAGAEWVSKVDLFSQSDVVSIHLVLGERSLGLVGAAELQAMKPGAILVNTARGPIVQEAALLEALHVGGIRAAIDVFDEEPLPDDAAIRGAPNLLLTPHLGYVTRETYAAFYEDTVANIAAYVGGDPIRVLNSEARR